MIRLAKSIYLVFLVLILILNFLLTGFFLDFIQQGLAWLYWLIKVIFFLVGMVLIFRYWAAIAKETTVTGQAKNLFTAALSIGLVLHVLEFVFVFIPISNHTQLSLASWTWEAYYSRNLNEHGFRDSPVAGRTENNRTSIFFVGDSYTEGFGLKNPDDRFSNMVADKLGDGFEVFNLGKSGTTTREQFGKFKALPFQPDIIVWQYFFNDLQDVCIDNLKYFPNLDIFRNLDRISKCLIPRSYLLNYLFFKFYPSSIYEDYIAFFKACSQDPGTQRSYFNLLAEIRNYCNTREIKLIFLIIPVPVSTEDSSEQDYYVIKYLDSLNIPAITPGSDLVNIPLEKRVISNQDMHLSRESNKVLADHIYKNIID